MTAPFFEKIMYDENTDHAPAYQLVFFLCI